MIVMQMKKNIKVNQKHRYTKKRNVMYNGAASLQNKSDCLLVEYEEVHSHTKVLLWAYDSHMELKRNDSEMCTALTFAPNKKTMGTITSMYGVIEVEIFTYKYIKKQDVIALEYDVLVKDEVSDGYAIIWNMKEE